MDFIISTHILDTSKGKPASSIQVSLEYCKNEEKEEEKEEVDNTWIKVGEDTSNSDGRLSFSLAPLPGDYRLLFKVDSYFKGHGEHSLYKTISILFNISNCQRKYHIPLLLNPYGYSTYQGS